MEQPNPLFDSIRAAFSPSPLGIALTVLLACLLIAGIAVFCVREIAAQRTRRKTHSEARYAKLRDLHALLPSEEDIIGLMVATLSSMNKRHLLLSNQGLFNACAQRLIARDQIKEAALAELRSKLGFFQEGHGHSRTSAVSFPAEYPVTVRDQSGLFRARVLDSQEYLLRLRFDIDAPRHSFAPSAEVDILYSNRRGAFVMRATVISHDDRLLRLSYGRDAAHRQRRVFLQRRIGASIAAVGFLLCAPPHR